MKTTHISDKEIQQYAFDAENCENIVIEHINSCEICKNVAESYLLMSKTIKEQPKPIFEFNLIDQVFDKLPATEQKPLQDYAIISASIILIFGIGTVALYSIKKDIINLIEIKDLTTYFIISVGVFIAIPWGLDMIKSFRKKMNFINFS